jgi:ATP-dependent DNA helicase RecG
MVLKELDAPLAKVKGAGAKTIALLAKLDIYDAASLLTHYPRDYEDRTVITPLAEYDQKKQCYVKAVVIKKEWMGGGYRRTLKVYVEDSSARACLVCF